MELKGKITKKLDVVKGVSKAGKDWQKQMFVIDTGKEYDNILVFDCFGDKAISQLSNKEVGQDVIVLFNIKCNEWEGKYFTSLGCWGFGKVQEQAQVQKQSEGGNDLPW